MVLGVWVSLIFDSGELIPTIPTHWPPNTKRGHYIGLDQVIDLEWPSIMFISSSLSTWLFYYLENNCDTMTYPLPHRKGITLWHLSCSIVWTKTASKTIIIMFSGLVENTVVLLCDNTSQALCARSCCVIGKLLESSGWWCWVIFSILLQHRSLSRVCTGSLPQSTPLYFILHALQVSEEVVAECYH